MRGPETIYRPWDTQTSTSRRDSLLTGCGPASAMAQGEDEERLKIEIKAGRAVSFDCMRRREKRKGRRRGKEEGRGGSMIRANDGGT